MPEPLAGFIGELHHRRGPPTNNQKNSKRQTRRTAAVSFQLSLVNTTRSASSKNWPQKSRIQISIRHEAGHGRAMLTGLPRRRQGHRPEHSRKLACIHNLNGRGSCFSDACGFRAGNTQLPRQCAVMLPFLDRFSNSLPVKFAGILELHLNVFFLDEIQPFDSAAARFKFCWARA